MTRVSKEVNVIRIHREKQGKIKVRRILDAACEVFCKKGFLAVTMQDIIDECGISRGGIYVYFSSVDEVFLELMKQRNKEKLSEINEAVHGPGSFEDILGDYMARQKKRLLNFERSLFRAYCEYIFSKPKAAVEAFRNIQYEKVRETILSILLLGVQQNVIRDENLNSLAEHIIVTIDGLSVLALAEALTERMVDQQLAILREMIKNLRV